MFRDHTAQGSRECVMTYIVSEIEGLNTFWALYTVNLMKTLCCVMRQEGGQANQWGTQNMAIPIMGARKTMQQRTKGWRHTTHKGSCDSAMSHDTAGHEAKSGC
jgi:hypothetical protein